MQLLQGIRVLESANFITGPYAGMLLADLGAEVIKIEKPNEGDPFRHFQGKLYSPHFQAYNRNKKSMTLDVRTEEGKQALYNLVSTADIFIENFRPGVTQKLGISHEHLRPLNPRLIYCSITGFGPDGPYKHRPSYDTVGQALSGAFSLYLDKENPRIPGGTFSDGLTGLYACYGILGALFERERTGVGRKVETNMLESSMAFVAEPFVNYFMTNQVSGPYRRTMISQSFAFVCQDELAFIIHLSLPEKFWQSLLKAVEREELNRDPRFDAREKRVKNYWELQDELTRIFRTKPRAYWLQRLEEYDVPFAPVYGLDEVIKDPQVQHLGSIYVASHPTEGQVKGVKRPVFYDGARDDSVIPPPTLGEHTDEILKEIKYPEEKIQSLRDAGII